MKLWLNIVWNLWYISKDFNFFKCVGHLMRGEAKRRGAGRSEAQERWKEKSFGGTAQAN